MPTSSSDRLITPHFRLREFLWSDTAGRESGLESDPEIRRAQDLAILSLAMTLEMVRSWYGKPISITSGVRDGNVQKLLLAKGIRSEAKSDHSYFSRWNPYGVGAVDWLVVGEPIESVYAKLYRDLPQARFGQAILYAEQGFIHLSNPRDQLLNVRREKARFLRRSPGGYETFST